MCEVVCEREKDNTSSQNNVVIASKPKDIHFAFAGESYYVERIFRTRFLQEK